MNQKPIQNNNPAPCGIARTTFSYLLDAVFSVLLMIGVYWGISRPFIMTHDGYYDGLDRQTSLIDRSGIVARSADKGYDLLVFVEPAGEGPHAYERYVETVWRYFTVTIPGDPSLTANVNVASTFSNKRLIGYAGSLSPLSQEYGKWIYENYFGYEEGKMNTNGFIPSTEDDFLSVPKGNPAFELAVLNAKMYSPSPSGDSGYYVDAVAHFANQPAVLETKKTIETGLTIAFLPVFLIPPFVFFLIVPLCDKKGRTLGKRIFRIYVAKEEDAPVKKGELVLRQTLVLIPWLFLALPNTTLGGIGMALLLFVDYAVRTFNKSGRALHDFPHRTYDAAKRKDALSPIEAEFTEKKE